MILSISEDKARLTRHSKGGHANRVRADGSEAGSWCTNYIGAIRHQMAKDAPKPSTETLYPQAYLNEQGPNVEIKAHFHVTDEFLLVVGGDARLGPHHLRGITLYFAGAYSAYGPIVNGQDGLRYFTLRNCWDSGPRFMPASRDELRAQPRQHRELVAGPLEPAAAAVLAKMTEMTITPVMAPASDGLGAWLYRLPPGQHSSGLEPSGGGGQYWIVTSGTLDHGGETMTPFSCIFVSAEEAALPLKAGPGGVELLAAQFPTRTFV